MAPGLGDILRGLFGGGGSGGEAAPAAPPEDYKGFTIVPTPRQQGGQWTVEGIIRKGEGEAAREHRLIRADLFAERDDAVAVILSKARRTIDEQGERIFG
mgnify:CR=1 FL=1|jgi:hypothetical protein